MARRAVHVAFLHVGHLFLAVAGGASRDRFLLGICALPIFACVDLGIEYFNGFGAYVCRNTAATFAAFLAVRIELRGFAPSRDRNVAKNRVRNAGGKCSLNALCGITGIIDGECSLFIPTEQFIHHGDSFFSGIKYGKCCCCTGNGAANGTPICNSALAVFQHGEGEGVVRCAELFGHHTDYAIKNAVAASITLIPVTGIGNRDAFGGVKFFWAAS